MYLRKIVHQEASIFCRLLGDSSESLFDIESEMNDTDIN
jgi:hypothetical protein